MIPGLRRATSLSVALFIVLALSTVYASDGRAWRGLLFDATKIVGAQEDIGWKIDKYEIEEMMPDMLLSVCQTPLVARQQARQKADQRVRELGGPLAAAIARGAELDALSDLLSAERVQSLLAEALRRASAECPLWLSVDPKFAGLQTDAYRFTLNLEGGGMLLAQRAGQHNDVGAGGTGRLLLAYGLSHRRTLLFGLEFGGNALFQRGDDRVNFPLQFVGAAPLVLRHHRLTFHHDLEIAPLVYFTDIKPRPSYGTRLGVTVGISLNRIRHIMPWAGFGVSLEYLFANDHHPNIVAAKSGARFGFDWDF